MIRLLNITKLKCHDMLNFTNCFCVYPRQADRTPKMVFYHQFCLLLPIAYTISLKMVKYMTTKQTEYKTTMQYTYIKA